MAYGSVNVPGVTKPELDSVQKMAQQAMQNSEKTQEDIIAKNATNILALDVAVSMLQGSTVAGTSDNIYIELFEDDMDFRIASGKYDSVNRRLYA